MAVIINDEHQAFLNPRGGWEHKAWGEAKRNPRNRNNKITRARDSGRESLGKQRVKDANDTNKPAVARSTG
ncbi:MAG TPA: hypothetical protein DC047_16725 [Blastocatellia bacterium]|nr:hypothetical protein [Blastocatellia bacterium]